MCQPDADPFHLSRLVTPALDSIIRVLSDRGGQTEAQRLAKGNEYLTLALSFLPRDATDMMLAGQTILFNELLADGTKDVLRGMVDTMKQRSQSTLVAMGRLTQGHVDRLEKRGNQPWRTDAATPLADPHQAAAAEPPDPTAVSPLPSPGPEPVAAATAEHPTGESSWLDEPFVQWLIEIPADLTAPPATANRNKNAWAARTGLSSDPALPRRPVGYPPALALTDVAEG